MGFEEGGEEEREDEPRSGGKVRGILLQEL